jgi:hypothetical protein
LLSDSARLGRIAGPGGGTTLHELGHMLAGWGAGHARTGSGPVSASACAGLWPRDSATSWRPWRRRSGPTSHGWWRALVDGHPAFMAALSPVRVAPAPKPCPAGVDVKGGTSRGQGLGVASAPVGLWVRKAGPGSGGQRPLPGPQRRLPSSSRSAFKRGKLGLDRNRDSRFLEPGPAQIGER